MTEAVLWLLQSNLLDTLQALLGLVVMGIVYAIIVRTRNSLRRCQWFFFWAIAVYFVIKVLRLLSPLLPWPDSAVGLIIAVLNFVFLSFFIIGMAKMLRIVQFLLKEKKRSGKPITC